MAPSLNLPNWTQHYPALRAALPGLWESARTDAARAALQRILDYPKVKASLLPLLHVGCSDKRQRWVADFLRVAACAVDAPSEKVQTERERTYKGAVTYAARLAEKGRYHEADKVLERDQLFGGPRPLERSGQIEKTRMRYARAMLCHATAALLDEPPYALIATLLTAVFKPVKPITPDSVRKFWEAEQHRLNRK